METETILIIGCICIVIALLLFVWFLFSIYKFDNKIKEKQNEFNRAEYERSEKELYGD